MPAVILSESSAPGSMAIFWSARSVCAEGAAAELPPSDILLRFCAIPDPTFFDGGSDFDGRFDTPALACVSTESVEREGAVADGEVEFSDEVVELTSTPVIVITGKSRCKGLAVISRSHCGSKEVIQDDTRHDRRHGGSAQGTHSINPSCGGQPPAAGQNRLQDLRASV